MVKRKWLLTVAGALAVAVAAVGGGVVLAQSAGEDGTGVTFLDRVAAKLGIETGTLEQALTDARTEEIDDAVESGDLSQEEADRLKERLENAPAGAPFFGHAFKFGHRFDGEGGGFGMEFGIGGPERFHWGFGPGLGFRDGAADLSAFLGITEAELKEELSADGATLSSVAEAHGKSVDELKAFITGKLSEKLDEAVANGDLTQEQADQIEARMAEHLDEMIDLGFPHPFREMKPFHDFPFERGMESPEGTETPEENDGTPDSSGTSGGVFQS